MFLDFCIKENYISRNPEEMKRGDRRTENKAKNINGTLTACLHFSKLIFSQHFASLFFFGKMLIHS